MKNKHLKIDWFALEEAFNNQNAELVYYLDLVTGYVALEGEGEDDPDDDEGAYDAHPEPPAPPQSDATRAYVEPPATMRKIEWLVKFIDTDPDVDQTVARELEDSMEGDDPAPRIKEAMNRHPEVRDRWYLFRTNRIQDMIGEWLAELGVETSEPAPWTK